MKLLGKVAIITGAAQGLGKAGAELFAQEGAMVAVADFDYDKAVQTAEEITSRGFNAFAVQVNVADSTSVENMVNEVLERYGKIDVLVNNAGITRDAQMHKMTEEQFDAVISVNLKGVYNCARAVVNHMLERGTGSIVNTSSVVGRFGNFGQTNYSMAKAGVIGATQTWAKEYGRKGIRTNAVAPGFIATDMTKAMPEKVLDSMKDKVNMKRLGLPEEVAKIYLFLASDDSSYVNGATIAVDGGLVL